MSETVITYLLSNPDSAEPMDRKKFYEEQTQLFKDGKPPSKAVEIVDILIFNLHKELLIQKRSFDKAHNPGLLDKSMGGHLRWGDTPDYAVMVETVQELQTPSIVLKTQKDFAKTKEILHNYLETVALIRFEDVKIHILDKIIDGQRFPIANKIHLYYGIYNGRVRPVDREAKGVLWYSLEELDNEMKKFPDTFTPDIYYLLTNYRQGLEKFLKTTS